MLSNANVNARESILFKYLFDYRNSINSTTGASPSELVFGRKLRSRLDLLASYTPPSSSDTLVDHVRKKQSLQVKCYGGMNKQCFKPDDIILYKKYTANKQHTWCKGTVLKKLGTNTYLIKDLVTCLICKKHKNQLVAYKGNDKSVAVDWDFDSSTNCSADIQLAQRTSSLPVEGGLCGTSQQGSSLTVGEVPLTAGTASLNNDLQPRQAGDKVLRPLSKTDYSPFFLLTV